MNSHYLINGIPNHLKLLRKQNYICLCINRNISTESPKFKFTNNYSVSEYTSLKAPVTFYFLWNFLFFFPLLGLTCLSSTSINEYLLIEFIFFDYSLELS